MKRNLWKRNVWKKSAVLALTAAVLAVTTACGNDASSKGTAAAAQSGNENDKKESSSTEGENVYDGVTIRIADYVSEYRLEIAYELGFFEEEFAGDGIDIEVVTIQDGPSFVDAVASNQVDFGIFGDQPIIAGFASGKNVEIIGSFSHDSKNFRLVAGQNSGIEKPADIKGKKIAISYGTTTHKMLLKLLEAEGLTEADVEVVNLGGNDARTALTGGDIDAAIFRSTQGLAAIESGGVLITDFTPYATDVQIIAANTTFAEQYPELAARFLKVVDRTVDWVNDNQEQAKEIVKNMRELTAEQAEQLYAAEDRSVGFTASDKEGLDDTAKFMYDTGLIEVQLTTDDFVDTAYLELAGLLEE